MRKTGLVVLLAALAVLASSVTAASATAPIVPSHARAVHDAKVEILDHYVGLMDLSRPKDVELMPMARVACSPLTDRLWHCSWMGQAKLFYTVLGQAKVRFYKYDTDVQLYDVKCYDAPGSNACLYGG